MSRPKLMNWVDDDIIVGATTTSREFCESCGHYTRCIFIHGIIMPPGVDLGWTKAAKRLNGVPIEGEHVTHIGIGCGCYAKFHRQVVHIEYKRTLAGKTGPKDVEPGSLMHKLEQGI
jgi:hypothetical protein